MRGVVERIVGLGGHINYGISTQPSFRIAEGAAPVVSIEHLSYVGGGIEADSNRTLLARSVSDCEFMPTEKAVGAEWFFEDVVTHRLKLDRQRLWARQLNVENEGTHIVNRDSLLWILGYKTERGGTLIQTMDGGETELLGGFSYTTTAGKLAPMFETVDSQIWAFWRSLFQRRSLSNADPRGAWEADQTDRSRRGNDLALFRQAKSLNSLRCDGG